MRGCRIRTTAGGITFEIGNAVPRNNTIVDNDVVGGATWVDDQLSADGYNGGEGIQFTGSGHVICFNHVANFRDDISFMEYDEAFEQTSIDICNNDIEQATDDAIEADSAMGNVRVFRNRIRNCFDGISAQPNLGGPTYYVRNVMFNVLYTPFKFHNGTVGDVVVHNTAVKCGDALGIYAGEPWRRALFRNNVFIGGMGGGTYGGYGNGSGRIFDMSDADTSCSFDYDGLGSIGTNTFQGRIGAATFNSFATLTANTSEAHAVMVDLGIFATPPAFPANPYPPKPVADLRLAAGSAAVDKGVVIPGLDDDFAGSAPDLGAYELGAPLPTYGPRTGGVVTGTGGAGGGGAGGAAGGGSGGATGGAATGGAGGGGSRGQRIRWRRSRWWWRRVRRNRAHAASGCGCASAGATDAGGFGLLAMASALALAFRRRRVRSGPLAPRSGERVRERGPRPPLALDQPDDVALGIAELRHDDHADVGARHQRLRAHRRRLVERVGDARHLHVERRARRVHRGADAAADRSGAGGRDHPVVLRVVRVDVPAEQVAEETHLGAGIARLNLPVDDARPRQLRGAGRGLRWRGLPRDRSLGRPGGFPRLHLGLGRRLGLLGLRLGGGLLASSFLCHFPSPLPCSPGPVCTADAARRESQLIRQSGCLRPILVNTRW